MMIITLKLLLAPALIAAATLAGRRWGPAVSGWLIGFPFISAPISLVMAVEQGPGFAARAAAGTLAGQVCVCLFSMAYFWLAYRLAWWQCIWLALGVYFGCTAVLNAFALPLLAAAALLAAVALLLPRVLPRPALAPAQPGKPGWDLPARMLTAVVFVAALSSAATVLGSQLSGLLSTLPIMGTILACFTHAQQGSHGVQALLRGSISGSFGILGFYLVVGTLLPLSGSLMVYIFAAAAAVVANGLVLRFGRLVE